MISFLETDPRLIGPMRSAGCAVLSGLYLPPDDYDPNWVNNFFARCVIAGSVQADCTILDWARFLAAISSTETVVTFPYQFERIETDRHYVCAPDQREILKWWIEGVHEDHFTAGNGSGDVAWDPMNRQDIMALPTTKFIQKVIVKVVT